METIFTHAPAETCGRTVGSIEIPERTALPLSKNTLYPRLASNENEDWSLLSLRNIKNPISQRTDQTASTEIPLFAVQQDNIIAVAIEVVQSH